MIMHLLPGYNMGAKIRGIQKAKQNLNAIISDVQGRKVVRALHSALMIGGAQAALYTPIDTSTLINSQYREIIADGTVVTGRVGYSAKYAVYVNDPAVVQNFRRSSARKEFLKLGFEDQRALINRTIMQELKL